MKCRESLNRNSPQQKSSQWLQNLVSLINQNMKLWGIWAVGVFGGRWVKISGPFPIFSHFNETTLAPAGLKIPGSQILPGFRWKCFCHLPGTWGYFSAAGSVNFCRTFKLNTNILLTCPLWNKLFQTKLFFHHKSFSFSNWSVSILSPSNWFHFYWVATLSIALIRFIIWEKHFNRNFLHDME